MYTSCKNTFFPCSIAVGISIVVRRDCAGQSNCDVIRPRFFHSSSSPIDQSILSIGYKQSTFLLFSSAGKNNYRKIFTLRRGSLSFAPQVCAAQFTFAELVLRAREILLVVVILHDHDGPTFTYNLCLPSPIFNTVLNVL